MKKWHDMEESDEGSSGGEAAAAGESGDRGLVATGRHLGDDVGALAE